MRNAFYGLQLFLLILAFIIPDKFLQPFLSDWYLFLGLVSWPILAIYEDDNTIRALVLLVLLWFFWFVYILTTALIGLNVDSYAVSVIPIIIHNIFLFVLLFGVDLRREALAERTSVQYSLNALAKVIVSPSEAIVRRDGISLGRIVSYLRGQLATGRPTASPPLKDRIDVSVFAKPEIDVAEVGNIFVFFHLSEELMRAARIASSLNSRANRLSSTTLRINVTRKSIITVYLESSDLSIDDAFQELKWIGESTYIKFNVRVLRYNTKNYAKSRVIIALDGFLIGEVEFTLSLIERVLAVSSDVGVSKFSSNNISKDDIGNPINGSARLFKSAFISYARKDVKEASLFAQGLSEHDINVFFDVDSIEPGEKWEEKIYFNIKESDAFYLMWSNNAAQSDYVLKEAMSAVNFYNSTEPPRPKIKPITISHGLLPRHHFYLSFTSTRDGYHIGRLK